MATQDVEIELHEVRVDVDVLAAENTSLIEAVTSGDIDIVRYLGDKGADVNIEDQWGNTPLRMAVCRGNVDMVRYLGDKGADVNRKDQWGLALLHLAIKSGYIDVARYLVEKGADVSIKDGCYGDTPLHLAATEGYHDVVTSLVDKGADVNIRNHLGMTPLHIATKNHHKETQKYLVDHGADVEIKDNDGNTPLHLAAQGGYLDAVSCLVRKGASVNVRNYSWRTPLHIAMEHNKGSTEIYLIDHGAIDRIARKDVLEDLKKAIQDSDERTFIQRLSLVEEIFEDHHRKATELAATGALCYAARAGSIPMMDILIQKDVDVNTEANIEISGRNGPYEGKRTPLLEAAKSGKADAVKYLVEKGAYVNIRDESGRTPLHEAVSSGNADTVRYLGGNGAYINVQDDNGSTPLHDAAWDGNIDTVEYLVENGAYFNIQTRDGWTPLHFAAQNGHVNVVRYLCGSGADVNIKDNLVMRTPLHEAAQEGNIDMVTYLCDKGADLNIQDDDGITPLYVAAKCGNVDVVRYLGDKGADIHIKDSVFGHTPLHVACRGGIAETVKYLLEKGADPTAKNDNGHNSLALAIDSRHRDVATFLLGLENWKEMLRSSLWNAPIMRELIAFMPDIAEVAFNRCVTTNEGKDSWGNEVHATSDTFEVDYNYEFLEDFQDKHSSDSADSWRPKKFTKYLHPLNLIREYDCSNLLKHPLVISLLKYKWITFGRYIFFMNLFTYLVFLAFLTAFGLVVLSPLEKTCVDVFNGSFNGIVPDNCEGLSMHEYRFLYVSSAVTILIALMRLGIEIFQLCRHPLEYLLDWVNWMEIPLYLFSIIFTVVFTTPCLCVYSWQWQIGVAALFLGWVGLITFLQKWPLTGVYVLMFVNILISFMKIAFLALLLVIAFALAFYMLMFEPDEMRTAFSHPARAIVKVMAMTTGELDYDDLFHQQEGEDEIAFPPVSFILWILFLVLMPVLLSNLLVGLAVGDVDHLQKTASEKRIGLQIDLILSFEELLESLDFRHRVVIKQSNGNRPNKPISLLPQWYQDYERMSKVRNMIAKWYSKVWITDEYSTSGEKISDAIKPAPESLEMQLQKQRQQLEAKLEEQGGQLRTQLKKHNAKQSEEFEAKLKEQIEKLKDQSEHQSGQLETKLKAQSEQLNAQSEQLKDQSEQLEAKLKEQSEQLEAKLDEYSEKQSEHIQEAVRHQLSECHKEQAKLLEEQSKKMEEKTQQLAGEVASLREALEKLITDMAAK